jgi:hypothetical protein
VSGLQAVIEFIVTVMVNAKIAGADDSSEDSAAEGDAGDRLVTGNASCGVVVEPNDLQPVNHGYIIARAHFVLKERIPLINPAGRDVE